MSSYSQSASTSRTTGACRARALLVMGICLWLAGHPLGVSAEPPIVRFSPEYSEIALDEVLDVELLIENVDGLYGVEIQMTFNPSVVEVIDMDEAMIGLQVQAGEFPAPDFVVKNEGRNSSGTIWYAVTQLSPRDSVSGSGRIFTMRLKGKNAGSCPLDIHFAQLVNRDALEMASLAVDGQVVVYGERTVAPPAHSPQPTATPISQETIPAGPTVTPPIVPDATRTPRPSTLVPTRAATQAPTAQPTQPGDYPQPASQPTAAQPTTAPAEGPTRGPIPLYPYPSPSGGETEGPATEPEATQQQPPAEPTSAAPAATPSRATPPGIQTPTPAQMPTTPAEMPTTERPETRVAALLPSLEPLPTPRPKPVQLKPLIPPEMFVCLLVMLGLFTLLLALYLVRWQKHLPH